MTPDDVVKKLTQDIIALYDLRVERIQDLRQETSLMLEKLKNEQEKMLLELKEFLAKEKSLRRKDFARMVKEILDQQKQKEKEIIQGLTEFQKEQKEMADSLRKLLIKGKSLSIKDFKQILKDVQDRQKQKEDEVKLAFRDFQVAHVKMTTQLQKLKSSLIKERENE